MHLLVVAKQLMDLNVGDCGGGGLRTMATGAHLTQLVENALSADGLEEEGEDYEPHHNF